MLAPDRGRLTLALLVLLTALTACALPRRAHARPPGPVRYHVELPDPHRQYVHLAMEVDDPGREPLRLALPAWTPGSYKLRDHARHLYDLQARDRDGRALVTTRIDKQTWQVEHGGRPFTVRYRVFAAGDGVRSSHVDQGHASLVGPSVFLYVVGQLGRPARVQLSPPQGWSAHSALPSDQGAPAGAVWLRAPDYDALIDAPIELGTPQIRRFTVDDTAFEYLVTGAEGTAIDVDRLAREAHRIAQAQAELMGGLPMSRYLFLLRLAATGGGGLEHADSTSMVLDPAVFDTDAGYPRAARLAAHEMFHLWNVKRIHDRVLGPFDYARENHTRLLWFHEGFTETMEASSLVRAGLVSPAEHVAELGKRLTRYLAKPGRNHEAIAQLSFEAWTKAYQPAPNHPNVAVSYYEKGDFIGVALDLELRLRSAEHGQTGSLPGVFRRLMASHGDKGVGITMADIVAAASAEAGQDMAWFFERYVDGTEELPLANLLPRVGVKVDTAAPWLGSDGRVRSSLTREQRRQRLYTGLVLGLDAAVTNVEPGSPADAAGLMRGDELVAVDGLRADSRDTIVARLTDRDPGQTVRLSLFRAGRLLERSLQLAESSHRTLSTSLVDAAELDPQTRALRDAWLAAPEPPPPQ
ncbi:MAG: PDZ domain-containing protein [Nannocystaceae bacterium]